MGLNSEGLSGKEQSFGERVRDLGRRVVVKVVDSFALVGAMDGPMTLSPEEQLAMVQPAATEVDKK
jgi:hypothetical protein